MDEFAFYHECEACGLRLLLTPQIAYDGGWDYPPRMGQWGIISPRTCGNCGIETTAWWSLVVHKKEISELSDAQYATVVRILKERDPYATAR